MAHIIIYTIIVRYHHTNKTKISLSKCPEDDGSITALTQQTPWKNVKQTSPYRKCNPILI